MKKEKVWVLRTSDKDRKSYNGFVWPESGYVEAHDWDPTPVCGGGLHGALRGEGDGSLFNWGSDATWQVVEVDAEKIIDLGGKVKFPSGNVIYSGDRLTATKVLYDKYRTAVIGATVSGGYGAIVSGGDDSTVSGGNGATVSGGNGATVSGGNWATVSGGDGATVSGGDWATVSGGYGAIVSGGSRATVSGGYGSILQIKWNDGQRTRIVTKYVGGKNIKPNVKYKLDENAKFIKA